MKKNLNLIIPSEAAGGEAVRSSFVTGWLGILRLPRMTGLRAAVTSGGP